MRKGFSVSGLQSPVSSLMSILAAHLLLPMTSPPIEDGALSVEDGIILEVGRREELLKRYPSLPVEDLGEAAILPGLVNVHTHLELTALHSLPKGPFLDWLLSLIEAKQGLDEGFFKRSASQGIDMLLRTGTTSVGEVTSAGASFPALKASGLRGIVYYEVLGLDPERAEAIAEGAGEKVEAMRRAAGGLLKIGLSPHAPYSLSERLLDLLSQLAQRLQLPLAVHLAETAEEAAYIRHGAGPILERLLPAKAGREGPSHSSRGETPVQFLARHGLLSPSTLAIHAVHIGEGDRDLLASHGVSIAHCPRSNHFLQVGVAPLPAYLTKGMRVGLGTDSLASNESLSLWDEMRFALELHGGRVPAEELLRMATLGGAEALGLLKEIGSLEPGKRADLIAVRLHSFGSTGLTTGGGDPYQFLITNIGPGDVLLTMVDGKVLFR